MKAKKRVVKKASKRESKENFLRVKFGILPDNRPEIYDFFYKHLPKILEKLGGKKVGVKIERLEALDSKHVNLPLQSREKIRHAMVKFTLSHALHRHHNVLIAVLPVKKLSQTLKDYDLLFDLFFTDLTVASRNFKVEMMDGFYNSLLLIGRKEVLEKIQRMLEHYCVKKPKFKFVNHK